MEKDINQLFIKISSKIEVQDQLELGDDVVVALKGSVVKTETRDNQDGSVDITYIVKPFESHLDVSQK